MFMFGAMKGLTPNDLTVSQKAHLTFRAALIGGAASVIAGGSYLRGALIGYNIAGFNYLEGEDPVVFFDEEGNKVVELQDVIVTPQIPTLFFTSIGYIRSPFDSSSYINSWIDSFGQSLVKHGDNSTVGIGNNIQVYWKTATQRPFYGNRYIYNWCINWWDNRSLWWWGNWCTCS